MIGSPPRAPRTGGPPAGDTDARAIVYPDQPTRRVPVYSADYADRLSRMLREDRERLVNKYTLKLATAHHAIRIALLSLEHGNVERAVRELRRGGAPGTNDEQET